MVNGSACPQDFKDTVGAKKFWLSTTTMASDFEAFREPKQKGKGWAEASCAATFRFGGPHPLCNSECHLGEANYASILALRWSAG